MLLLVLAFIVIPLVELYVIIQVGQSIGLVPTILLLLIDSIVGSLLLRSQGRAAWVSFNRALSESRMPAKEILDGVLIIFGGALLLTPGFLTDIVGLALLLPPTRAAVRTFLRRYVVTRFAMGPRAAVWGYGQVRGRGRPDAQGGARQPGGQQPAGSQAPPRARRPPQPEDFGWTTPAPPPREDAIEGTAQEVRDEDSLPPGERGSFPG